MNYIKRLKRENEAKQARIDRLEAALTDLDVYLTSNKFHSGHELDGYVNVKDIILRTTEGRQAARDEERAILDKPETFKYKASFDEDGFFHCQHGVGEYTGLVCAFGCRPGTVYTLTEKKVKPEPKCSPEVEARSARMIDELNEAAMTGQVTPHPDETQTICADCWNPVEGPNHTCPEQARANRKARR